MLIASLLPLLTRYSLGFDLVGGPDGTVTLTILPRKAEGAKHSPDDAEIRPIAITATAAEIDEELAKGEGGALGQLIASRKALADQLAEQRQAADDAKAKSTAKAKPAAAKPAETKTPPAKAEAPKPAEAKPGEPARLW
jgi:PRTRC genetic system protein E